MFDQFAKRPVLVLGGQTAEDGPLQAAPGEALQDHVDLDFRKAEEHEDLGLLLQETLIRALAEDVDDLHIRLLRGADHDHIGVEGLIEKRLDGPGVLLIITADKHSHRLHDSPPGPLFRGIRHNPPERSL